MKKPILLKIGSLNTPRNRWLDALNFFSDVYVFCFHGQDDEKIKSDHFHYIYFPQKKIINLFRNRILPHTRRKKNANFVTTFCIYAIRFFCRDIINSIKKIPYDYIHSSYNDFDESCFLQVILNIKKPQLRFQKETRIENKDYFEKKAFQMAYTVVFNDVENQLFFEKKYGNIFANKKIIYNLDEDVRYSKTIRSIKYSNKLSDNDKKIHAVILSGTVDCKLQDKRSGGRLFYLPLITKLLACGFIVHLHVKTIRTFDGANVYKKLDQENTNFKLELPLDFENDVENAYKTLSRYDIGILHAHIENEPVTLFDTVNIPHRYYEYHLAHVVPVDLRGKNTVLEKKHAIMVNDFNEIDLKLIHSFRNWDVESFSDYIQKLYFSTSGITNYTK